MSKLEIEIPDDRWFRGEWQFRPQDKQLCVVILNTIIPSGIPFICQYNAEKEEYKSQNDIYYHCEVKYWKPLGLPADVNERILAEIEEWFE